MCENNHELISAILIQMFISLTLVEERRDSVMIHRFFMLTDAYRRRQDNNKCLQF